MLTQVKTSRDIFFLPQRLLVPLFQRPYVWSREGQWTLLWDDVRRVAERVVAHESPTPHFLGAVVLQQQHHEVGSLSVRTIIDGQQRLTTLQLLLDSVFEQVRLAGFDSIAKQVQDLVENPDHFCQEPEDRYKVWPTNRDRAAFNEVMSAEPPIAYGSLTYSSSRMVKAHDFFSGEIGAWLAEADTELRANALVNTVSSHLQLVVIDLQPDEDAQEIFETLNARGTPLTAADLIKNFVFQRLDVAPGQAEKAYHESWEEFETPFWEKEVSSGRISYSRSSLFLNQWLISKTLTDVPAREVFAHFKRYVTDLDEPVEALLPRIKDSANRYRAFTEVAEQTDGAIDRLALFTYRTSTLESEIIKPLVLWLISPDLPEIPLPQRDKALAAVESYLVRRACARATSKAYNKLFVDLLKDVAAGDRMRAGDLVEDFLRSQTSAATYWPGDAEVRRMLTDLPIYRSFRRSRLRMLLEAIEDHRRGWDSGKPMHEQRVVRHTCTIEHLMPQEWSTHWSGAEDELDRTKRMHTVQLLGNLTLLTQRLNSKVSNGPWDGPSGKRALLKANTSILITKELDELGADGWNDELIHERTQRLIDDILQIWPVPTGHTGSVTGAIEKATQTVELADLVQAGILEAGQTLWARRKAHLDTTAQVANDGSLFIDGKSFQYPSSAAVAVTGGQSEAGWWFWVTEREGDRSLSDLRREYVESLDADLGDEED